MLPSERQSVPARLRQGIAAAFGIIRLFPVLLPVGLITLFAEMTYSGINNVTVPEFVRLLGISVTKQGEIIGIIVSTFLLAETFLRVPFGWVSDRFGRANVIIAAMLLSVPSMTLSGLVSHWPSLIPLRAWDGIMAAALWPSVYALVGDAIPGRKRANAMGVINMMYMLALFIGLALAAILSKQLGNPRLFFFIGASVIGIGGLIAFFFFRANPTLNTPHPDVHREDAESAVVKVSHHVILLTITFTQNFAITLLAPFMFKYATEDLKFTLPELALLIGMPVVGVGLLALPLSRLGDVLGKLRVVRIAFTGIALALWGFSLAHNLLILALVALVIAVAFSMGIPAWLAIISSLTSSKMRGTTMAGYGTVQGIAAVCGPLVAGVIWDKIGHPQIFVASAVMITIGALLAWFALPEHLHRHVQKETGTV